MSEQATTVTIDRDRVNHFMRAFRYGSSVSDLGRVDDRKSSGRYDDITWHIALDGATLFGFATEFRAHLVDALSRGLSEYEAEEYAFNATADAAGLAR